MALFSCNPSLYFLLEDTVNHVALGTMSLLEHLHYISLPTYPTDGVCKVHMTRFKVSGAPTVDWFSIVLFGCDQQCKYNEESNCVAEAQSKNSN